MQHSSKLKIILRYKYLIFILVILLSLIRVNINSKSKYNSDEKYFVGIVKSYELKDSYLTFVIKGKELLKCNYYSKDIINLEYGDKVFLYGSLEIPSNNVIPNTFNYKKYLKYNNIFYILNVERIEKIENTKNIIYIFKNHIQKRINKYDKFGYLNAFILGNKKYIESDTYNNYYKNGINHIFSISGMHISLLSAIILYVLNLINKNKKNIFVVLIFLFIYLLLTNYIASITRSIVFYFLLSIFKYKEIRINISDILLFSISIILLIKPNFLYNMGFIYSSSISYSLLFLKEKIRGNYLKKALTVSCISFLVSLPITCNINYKINLLSVVLNIIFVPLISFIIYPLAIISLLFPIFLPIFNALINIIELISNNISNINYFNISFPKINVFFIVIYYIILYFSFMKNKKYYFLLLFLIIFIKYINILDNTYYFYYLSVNQGDMIVIKHKNKSIVIDTGPPSYNKNNNLNDNNIKFLNSIGIYKINYLVISHGDSDHAGNALYLINNFKINKVIFNCGGYNDLEQEIIKVLDKKKIPYYSCIKELNLNNNKLYFLQTKLYDNENDNSNVIYTKINNYKFLFMGDASIETEKEILKKYNINNIDILKVGHHGSKTSSGKFFINEISPKYSIISVGKNNRYGHPNKEVLNNLEQSKIYRTDQEGSIMFKIKNNKLQIETCTP